MGLAPEPAFRNSTAGMVRQAAHTQTSTHSLTTVAHEAGVARYNIAMHHARCSTFSIPQRAAKCPNAMAQPLDDALSKCVLRPGACWLLQLKLARTRPGALSTGVARATTTAVSPFDLLVGDAAVCMSAGDPADSSLRDDADNMQPGQPFPLHWPIQSGYCSPLIKRTPDWCRSFEQRRIKHTSKNFVLPPICLTCICSYW
jgi:hypothetical protein